MLSLFYGSLLQTLNSPEGILGNDYSPTPQLPQDHPPRGLVAKITSLSLRVYVASPLGEVLLADLL